MASEDLLVTISGAALSLLLYENIRSSGNQMGFLLGEVLVFASKKVTDSDRQIEYVRTHINIITAVPYSSADLLHDTAGKLYKERLTDFVQNEDKQIVGWFRFRRSSSLIPTIRDKVLHKELASYFSIKSNRKEESFVGCFLNALVSNMGGTHKFRHLFIHHKKGIFEPVSLRINNLGNDASRHDGSDYKPIPVTDSLDEPDIFYKLTQSLNLDVLKMSGVDLVTAIQKEAEKYLDTLIPQVCESDREVANLEKEVHELRAKIFSWNTISRTKLSDNTEDFESVFLPEGEIEQVQSRKNKDSISKSDQSKICDEVGSTKDQSTSMESRLPTVNKQRNVVLASIKTLNQDKIKNLNLNKDSQSSTSQDPFAKIVSEMKMDIIETAASNRPKCNIADETPSIARMKEKSKEPNEFDVSSARITSEHESNVEIKKAKHSNISKSASE